jgi:hypothetical protein
MGKTQVAPKVKITIPRMELVATVNSVRLARKVKGALKIPLTGTRYFMDSSAVLGMLRTELGKFTEIVGARVREVKVNSNVEKEWLWLVGNRNPADLVTRSNDTPQEMGPGSEYQDGMPWMRKPVESWPCKKSFSPAPEEEFRKDMMEGARNIVKGTKESPAGEACFPAIGKGGLDRLVRVYGYVVAAIYKWRKKTGARGPVIINPIEDGVQRIRFPSAECQRAGELYLLGLAQRGMGISGAMMLATNVVIEEDVLGQKRKLITMGSMAKNQIAGVYGRGELPV